MAETTDQIRLEADYARHQLAEDLNRLESRVQRLSDWELWFQRYPWQVMGGAFAAAFALAMMVIPGSRRRMQRVVYVPVAQGSKLAKYLPAASFESSDSCVV